MGAVIISLVLRAYANIVVSVVVVDVVVVCDVHVLWLNGAS